ncbi:unnamed protein product [Brassica rapa]|uniref:AAA+ ATPase domain-containing protein n=1 Tax=Brassica campestris TaxID=3711 RepID=A0A8D9H7H2_BRACM|nr:unnamed protein product [Brassica rapa]
MATLYNQVPSVSSVFSLYTTFSAITMLLRTILNEVVPKGIREYITVKLVDYFSSYFQSDFTFVIEQHWGEYVENQTFRAAQVYLPTRLAGLSTGKLLVGSNNLKNPTAQPNLGIPVDTKIMDEFERIHLEWTLHNVKSKGRREKRYTLKLFVLKVLFYGCYFAYVTKSAEEIMRHRENLQIFTYNKEDSDWESAIFEHHTTFETLAIEPDLKTTLIDDLDAFSKGKDFFRSVGRAWKRGYLLYGPPGTGKSSMVAAIANHMKYNIYDLQIQSVKDDGELREILTSTTNRSILLIEDIDCGSDASRKRHTKEKEEDDDDSKKGKNKYEDGEMLDPALLRPGRMDVHILMDYCTPLVFNKLVSLYLKIDGHILCDSIEKLVLDVNTTPAEITQQLMASKDADIALKGVIEFLETKKNKKEDDTKVEISVVVAIPFKNLVSLVDKEMSVALLN